MIADIFFFFSHASHFTAFPKKIRKAHRADMQMVVHRHSMNSAMQKKKKKNQRGEIVQVAGPHVLESC